MSGTTMAGRLPGCGTTAASCCSSEWLRWLNTSANQSGCQVQCRNDAVEGQAGCVVETGNRVGVGGFEQSQALATFRYEGGSDVTHGRSLAAHLRGRIDGTALRCGELIHRDAPERSFNHID